MAAAARAGAAWRRFLRNCSALACFFGMLFAMRSLSRKVAAKIRRDVAHPAFQAKAAKQAPEAIAKRPVNFEVENKGRLRLPCDRAVWSTIIPRGHTLHAFAFCRKHRGSADKLPLAFR